MPDDGLTTRQRRNRPLIVVHTGPGKGKSTAAFGLALRAWNQGWPIGVFQFVKSRPSGGSARSAALAACSARPAQGGPVSWHKMGEGWSWIQRDARATTPQHAREGWEQIKRDLAAQTYRLLRAGRVHLPDEVGLGRRRRGGRHAADRPGHQHVVITGRDADPRLIEAADLVTEMTKIKHPMDAGQKGQRGIEW